jgi:VWFA-related protein
LSRHRSRRELLRHFVSLPGSALLATTARAAQQSDAPRISVTTRVVQVSIAVHDKNGRPVNDLVKEDFVVTDKGKPQTVASFVRSSDVAAAAPAVAPAPGAPRTWSNRADSVAGGRRSVTAILLDGLNTNVKDQVFAKEKILAFLRKLGGQDSVALYLLTTDLQVLHDFTDDAQALVRTLEGQEAKVLMQWARERGAGSMRGRLRHDRASYTLGALRAIGEHLSRIPGRKNLIWVTSGFPMLIMERERGRPGYIHDLTPEMRAVAKAIGDADVALYPVSAMGLVGVPQITAAQGATRTLGRGSRSLGPAITHSRQAGPLEDMMDAIAEDTGGRAFYERNDLDVALQQTLQDLGSTYTLTFHPSHDEWNGEYRQIRVQLRRKGLKARHRPGYVAVPDGPADTRDADTVLMDAIDNPLDSTGITLTVSDATGEDPGEKLEIGIDIRAITLEAVQERWKGELLVAVVPEPDGEAVGQPQVDRIRIDLSRERYDAVMKDGLSVSKLISREDRARGVRLFVVDVASRRVGSVNMR